MEGVFRNSVNKRAFILALLLWSYKAFGSLFAKVKIFIIAFIVFDYASFTIYDIQIMLKITLSYI